jgi:hypothetical protein
MEDLLRVNECSAAGRSHSAVRARGDSPGTLTARLLSIFLADFVMRGCAISFLTLARVASPAFFEGFLAFFGSTPPSYSPMEAAQPYSAHFRIFQSIFFVQARRRLRERLTKG